MNYNIEKTSSIANTLSALMGVQPVRGGAEELYDFVSSVGVVDRAFIYHPLLIGQALFESFSFLKDELEEICDKRLELVASDKQKGINSLLSMYNGVERGKNEENLFDKLVKERKRVVVILPKKYNKRSSFFPIEVELKYYDIPTQGINISLSLIKSSSYDFIVFVDSDYQEEALLTGPDSKSAMQVVQSQIDAFKLLANATEVYWTDKRTIIGFCPNCGAHRSLLWGRSSSRSAIDLNVLHYFKVQEKIILV